MRTPFFKGAGNVTLELLRLRCESLSTNLQPAAPLAHCNDLLSARSDRLRDGDHRKQQAESEVE